MRRKSVIVFLLITLISLISITEVFAQDDSTWFYNKPIARIIFDGLVHINREDVTAVTSQFLGKDFSRKIVIEKNLELCLLMKLHIHSLILIH